MISGSLYQLQGFHIGFIRILAALRPAFLQDVLCTPAATLLCCFGLSNKGLGVLLTPTPGRNEVCHSNYPVQVQSGVRFTP